MDLNSLILVNQRSNIIWYDWLGKTIIVLQTQTCIIRHPFPFPPYNIELCSLIQYAVYDLNIHSNQKKNIIWYRWGKLSQFYKHRHVLCNSFSPLPPIILNYVQLYDTDRLFLWPALTWRVQMKCYPDVKGNKGTPWFLVGVPNCAPEIRNNTRKIFTNTLILSWIFRVPIDVPAVWGSKLTPWNPELGGTPQSSNQNQIGIRNL